MRIKYSVAELLKEQAGTTEFRPTRSGELRWQWLDCFILPRPDLLELTGMPKGRFESYLRRKLLDIDRFGTGMGNHAKYKPLEAMKLMGIDGLSRAGAWDECLYNTFRHNGQFEGAISSYQFRLIRSEGRPKPIILNTPADRYFIDHPPTDHLSVYECPLPRAEQSWYSLEFDVAAFIEITVPRIIAFLEAKGVKVEDR